MSLIEQGYLPVLGLRDFQTAAGLGKFESLQLFLRGYDLLNEYDRLDVSLPDVSVPTDVSRDGDWCSAASLKTEVGESKLAKAFADSAARLSPNAEIPGLQYHSVRGDAAIEEQLFIQGTGFPIMEAGRCRRDAGHQPGPGCADTRDCR